MRATRLSTVLLMSFVFSATASAQVFDTVVNVPPNPDIGIFESVGGDGLTTQLNVFEGGSIGEGFWALSGSEVNINGGSIGDFFSARLDSVVNISGCTFSFEFEARSGSAVNVFGSDFVLDGAPLDSLTVDEAFTIVDRDVALSGVLADGSEFSLQLNSDLSFGDFFSPDARLTVTLVAPTIILGDCDLNGVVDFLDISPFIAVLASDSFLEQADCNQDGVVDFLDISAFIAILAGN